MDVILENFANTRAGLRAEYGNYQEAAPNTLESDRRNYPLRAIHQPVCRQTTYLQGYSEGPNVQLQRTAFSQQARKRPTYQSNGGHTACETYNHIPRQSVGNVYDVRAHNYVLRQEENLVPMTKFAQELHRPLERSTSRIAENGKTIYMPQSSAFRHAAAPISPPVHKEVSSRRMFIPDKYHGNIPIED